MKSGKEKDRDGGKGREIFFVSGYFGLLFFFWIEVEIEIELTTASGEESLLFPRFYLYYFLSL